jgi:hypothetical protein
VLSIDPITAVSLTNAIPRNDELAETPHSSSWSSALRGSRIVSTLLHDHPNLPGYRKRADSSHGEAQAEAIAEPFDPWAFADQTGTNFARPRLGKGLEKANQKGRRSEGLQVTN